MGFGDYDLAIHFGGQHSPYYIIRIPMFQTQTCALWSWHSSDVALALANDAISLLVDMLFVFVLCNYK